MIRPTDGTNALRLYKPKSLIFFRRNYQAKSLENFSVGDMGVVMLVGGRGMQVLPWGVALLLWVLFAVVASASELKSYSVEVEVRVPDGEWTPVELMSCKAMQECRTSTRVEFEGVERRIGVSVIDNLPIPALTLTVTSKDFLRPRFRVGRLPREVGRSEIVRIIPAVEFRFTYR